MPTRPSASSGSATAWEWAKTKAKTGNYYANMEAWNRSRPQAKPAQPSGAAPASSTARPSTRPSEQPPPPPPRSAAQARRQEAAFGTRRTGFAPASATGDEPPVKNQHYRTSATAAFEEATPAAASKPRPASEFVDPLSEKFSETFLDNRQRTPYAANLGEKTNPFEPLNVNRAKSMRDGGRTAQDGGAGDVPPRPPPRPRSASVGSDGIGRPAGEKPAFGRPYPQQASQASARYSPRDTEPNSAPPGYTFEATKNSSSSANRRRPSPDFFFFLFTDRSLGELTERASHGKRRCSNTTKGWYQSV